MLYFSVWPIRPDPVWPTELCLQDSPMHKALFWVAVAVLQLDEVNLYSAGTALLEQNLHTLDTMRVFNDKVGLPKSKEHFWKNFRTFGELLIQNVYLQPDSLEWK